MKKHNTKPAVNAFNKLSLWALTYFAVSFAFVADVVVVYLGQRLLVVKIIYKLYFQRHKWEWNQILRTVRLKRPKRFKVDLALFTSHVTCHVTFSGK